jgi:hypothetical protein
MVPQICLLYEVAGTSPLYFPIPENKTVGILFRHIANPSIFTQECYSDPHNLFFYKFVFLDLKKLYF